MTTSAQAAAGSRARRGHWMGTARVALRTRGARRTGDAGAALRSLAKGADRVVAMRVRGQHVLLLLDPSLVNLLLVDHAADTIKGPGVQLTRRLLGNGLLTSEGDDHRRARRLVAPAFSPRRLEQYVDEFASRAAARADSWTDGQTLDMHDEMGALTLDIVGRTLLGIDLAGDASGIRVALEGALAEFARMNVGVASRGFGRAPAAATQLDTPVPPEVSAIHGIVDGIVDGRRATRSDDRGDVVSALLAAMEGPDGLSAAEVHDHVITLLMAGHETTANALAWTLHLVGRSPTVQVLLRAELAHLDGRLPRFADLPGLTYTRAVVSEAMRLYPPAWLIGRTLTSDVSFAEWDAPAGTVVGVSPLLLHHDARWFPAPEVFDPGRWLDARAEAVPRHAYLPFGTGPRACIGEQFAWAEAVTILAVLAGRWSFAADPAHVVTPQYRVTLRPGNGVPVQVTR